VKLVSGFNGHALSQRTATAQSVELKAKSCLYFLFRHPEVHQFSLNVTLST
jgi:hypothetical protein